MAARRRKKVGTGRTKAQKIHNLREMIRLNGLLWTFTNSKTKRKKIESQIRRYESQLRKLTSAPGKSQFRDTSSGRSAAVSGKAYALLKIPGSTNTLFLEGKAKGK